MTTSKLRTLAGQFRECVRSTTKERSEMAYWRERTRTEGVLGMSTIAGSLRPNSS